MLSLAAHCAIHWRSLPQLPYTLRDILTMKGCDLEDPTFRAEAVAKLHAKAKVCCRAAMRMLTLWL